MSIKHLGVVQYFKITAAAQITTGSYADLAGSILNAAVHKHVSYVISCLLEESKYKVMGSNDRANWVEVVAEQTIGVGVTEGQQITTATYQYYKVVVKDSAVDSVGAVTFTGSGLDDMTAGTTFTGDSVTNYKVEIDGTGTPDTFKWSDDGGSTWNVETVSMTGSAQTLSNGVTITFAATTGHTLADYWEFTCTPSGTVSAVGIAK